MAKKLQIASFILILFLGIFFITNNSQLKYNSKSESIYSQDHDKINKFLLQKGDQIIEISRSDSIWSISGNDTLKVKEQSIDNFFKEVLNLKKTTLISSNPEKYNKYSINDSVGIHLALVNSVGDKLAHYIFGRSKSDYSRSYIRIGDDPNVYLTDQNIMHMISTNETYWGEKPVIEIPQPISNPDSSLGNN